MRLGKYIIYATTASLWGAVAVILIFGSDFSLYPGARLPPGPQFYGHVELMQARRPEWYRSNVVGTFRIENQNSYAIKSVSIECLFSSRDGTELMWVPVTLYDTVDSKSERDVKNVDLGYVPPQAQHSQCNVSRVVKL